VKSGEVQYKVTQTLKINPINAIDGAYFAIDQVIPRSSKIKARHEQPTTIHPSFGQTIHRGPQYQRVAKNPNQLSKSREKSSRNRTPTSHNAGDAQRRTKAKLSPSHLHKGSKAKGRDLRDRVFQAPPKGAALGTPSYRIGEWSLVMVPLRRWRGRFS
jgi:hypothetical protein